MRVVSLNGPAFLFLQRGEKLQENEAQGHNKFPDRRCILWPRGNGWDVGVKVNHFGRVDWESIAEILFSDEDVAWRVAYENRSENPTVKEHQN